VTPDQMLYVLANGSVGVWNPLTNASALVFTTASYTSAYFGNYEGNPSNDGRYLAVNSTRTSDSAGVVFVVDTVLGTKGSDLVVTAQGFASYADMDWASVSQSGDFLMLHGRIAGTDRRSKIFDRATLALVDTWNDYTLGHCDLGYCETDGTVEGVFGAVDGGTLARHVVARRIDTNAVNDCTGVNVLDFDWHASTRNTTRPGWGYIGVNDRTGKLFDGEIVAVRMDGSLAVERWGHHRANNIDYDSAPFAVPSPDGTRVMFASNWGDVSGRPVQTYVISLP
jgi:hypothetical protein